MSSNGVKIYFQNDTDTQIHQDIDWLVLKEPHCTQTSKLDDYVPTSG